MNDTDQAKIDAGLGTEEEFASLDEFASPDTGKQEVKHDRYGRYILPDPVTGKERKWTRVSTIAGTLKDTFHLDLWKGRMIAHGMGLRPDLVSLAGQYDVTEDKEALNKIVEQAKDAAGANKGANLGTALHGYAERLDAGMALPGRLAGSTRRSLDLYRETLAENGIVPLPQYMERVVLNHKLGIVGRLDRLYEVATYPLPIVGDLKSQKTFDFGYLEIATQLSLYSHADYIWNEQTQEWEEMPKVDQARAVGIHLPSQRKPGEEFCELHWIDLVEGWMYVRLAMSVRAARTRGKAAGKKVGRTLYWRIQLANAQTVDELSSVFQRAYAAGQWNDELKEFGLRRKEEIT